MFPTIDCWFQHKIRTPGAQDGRKMKYTMIESKLTRCASRLVPSLQFVSGIKSYIL